MSESSQLGRAQIMQMTFFLEIAGFVRNLPVKNDADCVDGLLAMPYM